MLLIKKKKKKQRLLYRFGHFTSMHGLYRFGQGVWDTLSKNQARLLFLMTLAFLHLYNKIHFK